MLLHVEKVHSLDRIGRKNVRSVFHSECDHCKNSFIAKKRCKTSYCSKVCVYASLSRRTKLSLAQKAISHDVQEKRKRTCLARFGVDHPWKSQDIREKCLKTFCDRYGSLGVLGSDKLRESYEMTMMKRHGAKHPMLVDDVKKSLQKRA